MLPTQWQASASLCGTLNPGVFHCNWGKRNSGTIRKMSGTRKIYTEWGNPGPIEKCCMLFHMCKLTLKFFISLWVAWRSHKARKVALTELRKALREGHICRIYVIRQSWKYLVLKIWSREKTKKIEVGMKLGERMGVSGREKDYKNYILS